ncbi:unnamed protein product [Oreochromis niloticus]|nr:unnamed protein product [Mustela putorius furo]
MCKCISTSKLKSIICLYIGTNTGFCGLLTAQKDPVPLKSFEVELEVRDHVATVVSTLNYENKEDKPLEAVFVFPLPGDAAVCHFSAQVGQTQIVAELKEKQEARQEYDDALSSGQQAFLLEESDESPDVIFSLHVGSLPPGESASIRLEYVTELAVQADDGLRFCLPAVLNPPTSEYLDQKRFNYISESLEPPSNLHTSGRTQNVKKKKVSSNFASYFSKVESNCSLDPLQYLNTDQTQATVKLAAGHKFDRDVELLIYYKDAHQPTAVVEAGQASAEPGSLMGDPVVMVSLYPEFPQSVMSSMASCGEFVFLVDRSGSMDCPTNDTEQQETRISSARDTLLLLLNSLPMGCYFNIYSFGSSYEQIFPSALINGMAKEGGGHAQFITGTDRMQPKVMQSLHFSLQPAVEDVSVTWDLPKGSTITVLSPPITSFFQGQRSLIYAQLTGQSSEAAEGCVTLKYSLAGHRSENQLYFSLCRGLWLNSPQLSVQSGVSSSFTAFIVVNTDNNKEIQGPLLHRDIPMAGLMRCAATPCCYSSSFSSEFPHAKKPPRDPLLQLVSLQKASGCWLLDAALAAALGKTNEEVEKSKPEKASSEVWATILALIWLHGFKMDAKDEWELLAAKAVSWLSAQKAPSVTECVEARNILLGCSVQKNCPWPLRFLLS